MVSFRVKFAEGRPNDAVLQRHWRVGVCSAGSNWACAGAPAQSGPGWPAARDRGARCFANDRTAYAGWNLRRLSG